MKVSLIAHTHEPEKIVSAAAKLCYSSTKVDELMNNLTESKIVDFITRLSDIGHESPFEHVSFTFAIEGISRACLAQLTRHRIASYSVQSQRYINFNDYTIITPPEIRDRPELKKIYDASIKSSIEAYHTLTEKLVKEYISNPEYIKKHPKDLETFVTKKALEDARFVLPNAFGCSLIVTMNARSLMNFFSLRCCNRAQWEIRQVAEEMLTNCAFIAPNLFKNSGPSCVRGRCKEGAMSCKNANEVISKIDEIKKFAKEQHNNAMQEV